MEYTLTPNRQPIQFFFVDDEEDNLKVLEPRFRPIFRSLGCDIEFVFEDDADRACQRISQRGVQDAFPVVMADLLFRAPGYDADTYEPRGVEVIKDARLNSDRTVIVALTQGSRHQPSLERDAREAGADIVLRREQLLATARGGGPQELVREVYALMCERDLVRFGPTLEIPEEPGIQSIAYDAGQTTLRLVVADVFAERQLSAERVTLSYVTPGASGARVMRAAATLVDGSQRQLLIKIGTDRNALLNEQQNYDRSAGLYRPDLLVPYLSVVGPRNGWSALAMWFASEVVTLREWVTMPLAASAVPRIMDRLFFHGGLTAGYRSRVPVVEDKWPIRYFMLPPFRRVLVRAAIKELLPVLAHSAAGAVADSAEVVRVIEGFTRDGRLDGVAASETPRDLLLFLGHGDLHGGNILVSTSHVSPMLVDLSRWGPNHWAGDVARLAVDLLMWGLDSGVESFFWNRFPVWREAAQLVGGLEPLRNDNLPSDEPAVAALNWIVTHKLELLPPFADHERIWEWHLALAEQLARRTYDKELPPAKRTLAVLACYDQLLAAARQVPRAEQTF